MLAFEPPDLGPLLGGAAGQGSIGGAIACNLSGPRRIKAGAARDHFLGFHAVSGRGEVFKSGGRVVKNVTGYDLCKLMAGAYGTLSALTDVAVKVMPAPEKTRTVLLFGLDDAGALSAMTRALGSAHEVSGAAHLPAELAAGCGVSYVSKAGGAVTALRVEGPAPSVEYRCAALRRELSDLAETEELHSMNSAALWRELRDVNPFVAHPRQLVWRISVPPRAGPGLAARIAGAADALYYYDWGGGLVLARPARAGRGGERCGRRRHPRRAGGNWRPCYADPCAGRGACRGPGVPAAGCGERRAHDPRQGQLRSQPGAQPGAHVRRGVEGEPCRPTSRSPSLPTRMSPRRTRSCAPACTAASASRRARPTCCSATSWIARAGRIYLHQGHAGDRQAGEAPGSRCTSTGASHACRA